MRGKELWFEVLNDILKLDTLIKRKVNLQTDLKNKGNVLNNLMALLSHHFLLDPECP